MPLDLARLPHDELQSLAAFARDFEACDSALTSQGGILANTLDAPLAEWRHYPAGDVYDPATHAQFFYHAHPPSERAADEHGHFHTFLRAGGMKPGVRPLVLPELAIAGTADAAMAAPSAPVQPRAAEDGEWCHLIAIAMSETGRPMRLFTTNRWVTGETWYRAVDVAGMIERFAVRDVGPKPLLGRWIAALVGLYRPEIAALVAARDEAVMGWRRRRRGKMHVFDDRRLEITSSAEISPEARCREIAAAVALT